MHEQTQKSLKNTIAKILKPLIRILIRYNFSFGDFMDLAKNAYVDIATNDFKKKGKKQSNTNIAILTGFSRREVLRIQRQKMDAYNEDSSNRAVRVITGWQRDKNFQDKNAKAKALHFSEGKNSFTDLVKKYSGDISAVAIFKELLRVGVVNQLEDGRIDLISPGYIPQKSEIEKINILGMDTAGLISTIDQNLKSDGGKTLFQRKVYYNNLPPAVLEEFQQLINNKGQELLEFFDNWLSKQKRESNPEAKGAGLGLYYFEEKQKEEPKG